MSRGHQDLRVSPPCEGDHVFCSETLSFVGWLLTVLQTGDVWGYLGYKYMIYYSSFQVLFSRLKKK